MASYIPPGTEIFQEFNVTPAAISNPMNALIAGPQAFLLRYSVAEEKLQGFLGEYDPSIQASYQWPQLPVGGLIDQTYTKVFIDSAKLNFFSDLISDPTYKVQPVAGKLNQIRIFDPTNTDPTNTYGFVANGTAFPRFPALYDRDVQLGDVVDISATVGGTPYNLTTYVLGFAADQLAATVGNPVPDDSNGNKRTQLAGAAQLIAGVSNCNLPVADLAKYSAWPDGFIDDVYTITVLTGSTGGDLRTAVIKITTSSGKDDVSTVQPGEIDQLITVGNRGLRLKFTCTGHSNASLSTDDLVPGQTWTISVRDDYTPLAAVSGGAFTGDKGTKYIVAVTRGGNFSDPNKPQVTITTVDGIDASGPATVGAMGSAIPVGNYGVTITFSGGTGMRLGDKFYITVTAAQDGRISTLLLGHNVPSGMMTATDINLYLSLVKNINLPATGSIGQTNWTQSQGGITIEAGLSAFDSSLTYDGQEVATPVIAGEIYVEYRAWMQGLVGEVNFVSDIGQVQDALGTISPDNPLAEGVADALTMSNGTSVGYIAVSDPTNIDAWAAAIDKLVGRRDVYEIVPLTTDPAVLQLFLAHVNDQSGPTKSRFRAMWISLVAKSALPVVSSSTSSDGNAVLATVSVDPDAVGPQPYTIFTIMSNNADAIQLGARVGDTIHYNYTTTYGVESWDSFSIAEVINEHTFRAATGYSAAQNTPIRIEIWHPLTQNEVAADLVTQAQSYASTRVCAVWPDTYQIGGTTKPGYFLCCLLAGQASGVVPQQDLTFRALSGVDNVDRSTKFFNAAQLNTMAAGGIWIVIQTMDGTIITRDALTTSIADRDSSSEMIRRNLDSVSFFIYDTVKNYIGVMNVVPTALARIQVEIVSAIEILKNNGTTDLLGSQLIDGQITQLRQDAIFKDTVICVITVTLPRALKHLQVYIVVN
jgi:hypothetical protein